MNNRNFRNLLLGIGITNFGDSLFLVAIPIFIYAQTKSDQLVSMIALASILPFLFGFLIGPMIDVIASKKGLIYLQLLQIAAISSVFLIIIHPIAPIFVPILFVLLLFFNLCNYGIYVAVQASIPKMVESQNLAKSNSYISSSRSIVNGIADGVSGFLIQYFSIFHIFVIDIFTYVLSLPFFLHIFIPRKVPEHPKESKNIKKVVRSYLQQLSSGFVVLFQKSYAAKIVVVAMAFQFQTKLLAISAVGYFSSAGVPSYYAFYFAAILIGFSLGCFFSNWIFKFIPFRFFAVIGFILLSMLWIPILTFFNHVGLLVIVCLASFLSGVMEISIVTLFQELFRDRFGNTMTLLMTFSGIAQLIAILTAPRLIQWAGHTHVILYAFLPNLFVLLLLSNPPESTNKEAEN